MIVNNTLQGFYKDIMDKRIDLLINEYMAHWLTGVFDPVFSTLVPSYLSVVSKVPEPIR